MATLSLKNEAKKTLQTYFAPIALGEALNKQYPNIFTLTEIKFQADTKIEFTFAVTDVDATQYACANVENPQRELLERVLDAYHQNLRANADLKTTYPETFEKVVADFPDLANTASGTFFGIALAKCNKKNGQLVSLVNFKALSAIPAAAATPTPAPQQKQQTAAPAVATTQTVKSVQNAVKAPTVKQVQTSLITDVVLSTLFNPKAQYDFTALEQVYKVEQQIVALEQQLIAATKEKHRAPIQAQIDAAKASVTPEAMEKYAAFKKSLQTNIYPQVVNTANQGYSQGIASVFTHPAAKQ
eukprot:UN04500